MKPLLVIVSALLFAECLAAQECVILKRMGPADQLMSRYYSFGLRGKQFQFVEGQMPEGIKWHGRLTDNDVRKLQDAGAKIVIIEPKFTGADLAEARKGCSSRRAMKTGVGTRGRISRQQQSAPLKQRTNAVVSQFQAGQSRQQEQVDHFSLALNGDVSTNDPTHPTVAQTHPGKWNCGARGIVESNLSPGPDCFQVN